MFSTVATPFYILTISGASNMSTALPTRVTSCLFYLSHPRWCKVVFHCGFDLYLPVANGVDVLIGDLQIFVEMSVHILCQLFNLIIFLVYGLVGSIFTFI
jgi:hypothetical protein